MEIWKDINGFYGYQVSNLGNVRSVNRTRMVKSRYGGYQIRTDIGADRTPTDNGNGYLIVSLQKDGKRKNRYVHRLVAEAFCEKPEGCDFVDHIDYNRKNNKADNLRWVTQLENVSHSIEHFKKQKTSKLGKLGEKYIYFHHGYYRLMIPRLGIDSNHITLEEAINARREVITDGELLFVR